MKKIVIPESVTKIGQNAFDGCTNLKTIYVPAEKTEYYKKLLEDNLHDIIVELK